MEGWTRKDFMENSKEENGRLQRAQLLLLIESSITPYIDWRLMVIVIKSAPRKMI